MHDDTSDPPHLYSQLICLLNTSHTTHLYSQLICLLHTLYGLDSYKTNRAPPLPRSCDPIHKVRLFNTNQTANTPPPPTIFHSWASLFQQGDIVAPVGVAARKPPLLLRPQAARPARGVVSEPVLVLAVALGIATPSTPFVAQRREAEKKARRWRRQ